jgi:AcrR family transcriptional regulator
MRRVAAELGTGTTSLYRYVSSKDDLFDLMVDHVLGSVPPPQPTYFWRDDLSVLASWKRELILDHPWMAAHEAYTRTVIDGGRFPMVTRAWLDAREPHAADRAERGFRHGLDRLLDGYATGMRRARE